MSYLSSKEQLSKWGLSLSERDFIENSSNRVLVGMSGGVDSSVSALLLKLQGYDVLGLFMKNWEDESEECTAEKDFEDVARVCEKIDIPYFSINFATEYRDNVFKHFLEEYSKGHTPNPDILCNKEIKFKVFFDKARELGADYLATGHYCQHVIRDQKHLLVKGSDQNKDQTYFLYTMQAEVLEKVLFPIGNIEKKIVREIARNFDLITHDKKDSTGICFIGERNFRKFLSDYIAGQKGPFVRLDDQKIVGNHPGQCFFTIGQRKGLGLGGPGGPWFVAKKDVHTNTVFVVEGENHPALFADYLIAEDITWVNSAPTFPLSLKAKIRYRQQDMACLVSETSDGKLHVKFEVPQRAISVGQSVVFYQEDICLGGAVIVQPGPSYFDQQLTID